MPRIFDNIERQLVSALTETLSLSSKADFCVGYFNLRGWKNLNSHIESWSGGEGNCCRLLVGMQRLPQDELRQALSLSGEQPGMDNQTALRLKKRLAEEFRDQLATGMPTSEDEIALRRLAAQIKAKKVVVKLFLRYQLHAKLYLLFRSDPVNPITGFLGSSNLTFAGLLKQGELNIDVLDHDACNKLAQWFEERWTDRWCIDISEDLVKVIEESWAREDDIPPYHIYLKIAYHLAQEARAGLSEFSIPRDFGKKLFDYQTAAVKIAAHHLNKRGGVMIGDVVGLGKTLMATALARIFEDDYGLETLIICPKNLVTMWDDYCAEYRLRAKIIPISQVQTKLSDLRRYRLVLIDESHNLRNRQGKRYLAIQEYIRENESKCILLTATPYNKTYQDLSNQLRLFIPEETDLGVRPEELLRQIGETEFIRRHQCPVRSLAAFEKSEFRDDWRELMRLFMVRRTRTFILENYADTDPETGRPYLTFEDGSRSYFPVRKPRTVKFTIDEKNVSDQYAGLYRPEIVDIINGLNLPRYGLGNYVTVKPHKPPTQSETVQLKDLGRAGKRLMGFCRTNLFKRLESSGIAFIQSIERHILRNFVFVHALETKQSLPIGSQDAAFLDTALNDGDVDDVSAQSSLFEDDNSASSDGAVEKKGPSLNTEDDYHNYAAEIYNLYAGPLKKKFKWLRAGFFVPTLVKDLRKDSLKLMEILEICGEWQAIRDEKLNALTDLLVKKHPNDKVLVFTQFADTVKYLTAELGKRGVDRLVGVTGNTDDPTKLTWRFSPKSNNKQNIIKPDQELRVLIATDVLSEGQNLQDCAVIINYDLPWAIIRLIQRAGRVDRIGQTAEDILCYSFLPAEGVERIIRLRDRVHQRLQENAEVVGTDESFFEDDGDEQSIVDLYNERSGILDGDADNEVDLASYAYQIWKNAVDTNPDLQKIIPDLPPVVYSSRRHQASAEKPEGVLVYMRTADGNDALAWMDKDGKSVTESQFIILKAAACSANTPALPRSENHHELVRKGAGLIISEERRVGGQLGRPSGARFRTYERLKRFADEIKGTLFEHQYQSEANLFNKAIEDIYRFPLRQTATDTLNRQLRSGIADQDLAELVISLREEDRLCITLEDEETREPKLICSLGLIGENEVQQ